MYLHVHVQREAKEQLQYMLHVCYKCACTICVHVHVPYLACTCVHVHCTLNMPLSECDTVS